MSEFIPSQTSAKEMTFTIKTIPQIKLQLCTVFTFQEDFQPMTYGFKMAGDVTDVRASGMMKEIEDELNRTIKVNSIKLPHLSLAVTCKWEGSQSFSAKICILTEGVLTYFQNTRSKAGEERHLDKEKEVYKYYILLFLPNWNIRTKFKYFLFIFAAWISISSVRKNSILSTFLDNVDYIQQRKSKIL